ncbi:hypothetical protein RDABS01_030276 [Bienertia sinuspersici]
MLLSGKNFMLTKIPHNFVGEKGKRFTATFAKKPEISNLSDNKEKPIPKLKIPKNILAQSAIAVLGLGYVDAGYSGDWSRIGVISKEAEEMLKIAAFLVVPLCLFAIINLARKPEK